MGAAIAVLLTMNVWWLHVFSSGYPLDIDESAYLDMGFVDAAGLQHGGITGLWDAVMSSHLQAPLAPLLTVPFHFVLGWRLADGFGLTLVLWAALMWMTYEIALLLTRPAWAVAAGIVVGTTPGIVTSSRVFQFALPLAVFLTGAVWALMRSNGLDRTGWCVLAGVFLGCAPLSRTMGLAFLPGPVAVAAFQAVTLPRPRRRLLNLAALLGAGLVIAYPWLHANLSNVLHYLQPPANGLTPGVGSHTRALWEVAAHDVVLNELFVPLAAGLLACFVAAAIGLAVRPDWRAHLGGRSPVTLLRRVAAWGPVIPLATLLAGWLAISVNQQAVDQWIPLIPCLVVLAVTALAGLRWARVRWAIFVYLSAVTLLNVVSQSDTISWLSRSVSMPVPVLGTSPLIDGNSSVLKLLSKSHEPGVNVAYPLPAVDRAWTPLSRKEASFILSVSAAHHEPALVTFASRDRLFNTNTLQLAGELWFRQPMEMHQLISTDGVASVAEYRRQLQVVPPGVLGFMVSVDNGPGGYTPAVNQARAQKAASSLGYVEIQHFVLPDGRHGSVWAGRN